MGGGEEKGPEDSRTPKGTRVTTRATPPSENRVQGSRPD
jgi:hypothetical protein